MYKKPLILVNDDLAEGVYAASGAGDCWAVSGRSVQDWNGSHNVFEMCAVHSKDAAHNTTQVVYTYTFSAPVTNAYAEGGLDCQYSGNTVTVTRNLHANGYHSGDNVTFKVWVRAADEATTKAIALTGISYVCRHEENVQGGID